MRTMDLTPREILCRLTETFSVPVKVILWCENVEIVDLEISTDGVVVTDSGSASEWFAEAIGNHRIHQVAANNHVTVTPGPNGLHLQVEVPHGADLSEAVAALARTLDQLASETEVVRLDENDDWQWEQEPWTDWYEPLDVASLASPPANAGQTADLLHQLRRHSRASPEVIVAPDAVPSCWVRLDSAGGAVVTDGCITWDSLFEFDDPRVPELREQFFAAVKPTSAAAVFDPTLTCGEIVLQLDESLGPDQACRGGTRCDAHGGGGDGTSTCL